MDKILGLNYKRKVHEHTIRTFSRSGVISISTVSKQPEGKTLSSQPLIKMKTDCFKSLFYSQDLFTIVAPYGFHASIPHGRKRFDFDWFSCRVQTDLFCVRSNWRVTKFVFKYTLLSSVSLQKKQFIFRISLLGKKLFSRRSTPDTAAQYFSLSLGDEI